MIFNINPIIHQYVFKFNILYYIKLKKLYIFFIIYLLCFDRFSYILNKHNYLYLYYVLYNISKT